VDAVAHAHSLPDVCPGVLGASSRAGRRCRHAGSPNRFEGGTLWAEG
jgi:hypothetical protein